MFSLNMADYSMSFLSLSTWIFTDSPSPLGTYLGFKLGLTRLGLGLGGFGTKGLGQSLDN